MLLTLLMQLLLVVAYKLRILLHKKLVTPQDGYQLCGQCQSTAEEEQTIFQKPNTYDSQATTQQNTMEELDIDDSRST